MPKSKKSPAKAPSPTAPAQPTGVIPEVIQAINDLTSAMVGGTSYDDANARLTDALTLLVKLDRALDALRYTVESGHNCGLDGVDSDYLCAMDEQGTAVVALAFGAEAVRHPKDAGEDNPRGIVLTKEECWCKNEGAPFN